MIEHGTVSSVLLRLDDSWPLGAAAREFVRAGVPIFPCAPNGKRPLTQGGFHDATTDLSQVQAWWDQTPTANIGLPTGQLSGVVVVDIDLHEKVTGYEAINRAHHAGKLGSWEAVTRTPSGGAHMLYPATPATLQRSWQAARAGVDFRGDGGYVIVPPSHRHIDGQKHHYRLEQVNNGPATTLDSQGLRDFLDPRPAVPAPESRGTRRAPNIAALADRVANLREGERNLGLFKAACRLAENGMPPGEALDILGAAAGQAGLGQREISRTVQSAYHNVHGSGARQRTTAGDQRSLSPASAGPSRPPMYRVM